MKNRVWRVLLALTLTGAMAVPALADMVPVTIPAPESTTLPEAVAAPTDAAVEAPAEPAPIVVPQVAYPLLEKEAPGVAVVVDGVPSQTCVASLKGWTSYVSFYYGAKAIRPDLAITWESGVFVARAEDVYMTVSVGEGWLQINDRYLAVPGGVLMAEDGAAWVPVRVLATALGAQVDWDGRVRITAGGSPLDLSTRPYSDQDLDILSKVIQHEAGWEPFQGQIAVGNVIMNRIRSSSFPNTVYDVVFAPNQFSNATKATPRASAIKAARIALEEAVNVAPGAYYFNGVGKPCWASRYKKHLYTIGNHAFFG